MSRKRNVSGLHTITESDMDEKTRASTETEKPSSSLQRPVRIKSPQPAVIEESEISGDVIRESLLETEKSSQCDILESENKNVEGKTTAVTAIETLTDCHSAEDTRSTKSQRDTSEMIFKDEAEDDSEATYESLLETEEYSKCSVLESENISGEEQTAAITATEMRTDYYSMKDTKSTKNEGAESGMTIYKSVIDEDRRSCDEMSDIKTDSSSEKSTKSGKSSYLTAEEEIQSKLGRSTSLEHQSSIDSNVEDLSEDNSRLVGSDSSSDKSVKSERSLYFSAEEEIQSNLCTPTSLAHQSSVDSNIEDLSEDNSRLVGSDSSSDKSVKSGKSLYHSVGEEIKTTSTSLTLQSSIDSNVENLPGDSSRSTGCGSSSAVTSLLGEFSFTYPSSEEEKEGRKVGKKSSRFESTEERDDVKRKKE